MKIFLSFFFLLLTLPGFCQEEDEKFLEELEAERRKQTEVAVEINKVHEGLKEKVFNFPEEMRKLGHEELNMAALADDKVLDLFQKALKENQLRSLPREKVVEHILNKSAGTPAYSLFKKNPKFLNIAVDFLRDEKALPAAIIMLKRRDDLKLYFAIWIGLMILSWLFKKAFFNPNWGKFRSMVMGLFVTIIFSGISLGTFYKMFYEELSPMMAIILRNLS
ncbi:MAG: hypothetical protein ACLGHN_01425 [Bacteriovoracia bacterium]